MNFEKNKLGYCGHGVNVVYPNSLNERMYLYDDVNIQSGCKFIVGKTGKIIMKKRSRLSKAVTIITGKHSNKVGVWSWEMIVKGIDDKETTITIEEDVRVGANSTIMANVTLGRGCQVGACAVVTKSVPPYAIVAGNPARFIKFIFSADEIIEHEKILYSEEERLSEDYIKTLFEKCQSK